VARYEHRISIYQAFFHVACLLIVVLPVSFPRMYLLPQRCLIRGQIHFRESGL
jgi:hypothetical protein